jgi:hypothetical protein
MMNEATVISDRTRSGLARIVAVILPGTDRLPSGLQVGAHEQLLDAALAADPRLTPAVIEFGDRAADVESLTIDDLIGWSESSAETVVFALTASYYMSTDVRLALGYPGQQRRPINEATPEEQQTEDLLEPVISRGPVFVPTDGSPSGQ